MSLRWAFSGGNFCYGLPGNTAIPGYTTQMNGFFSNTAPAGVADSFCLNSNNGPSMTTVNLGTYTSIYLGMRFYVTAASNNQIFLQIQDAFGNPQCDVRSNSSNQFYLTRNGTTIGTTSTQSFPLNAWTFLELGATLSSTGAGTCNVKVNSVSWINNSSLTNAQNTNGASMAFFRGSGVTANIRDMYVVDGAGGTNTSFLGDISVIECFADGAGVNSAWTPNVGAFALTSVNGSGVYTGTITGGASNAYQGYSFVITGFTNANNNGTFVCTASSATTLTLTNTTTTETATASAAFQCIVEIGANKTGTRPNGDVAYIASSTTNAISDFAHQPLTLSGTIPGIIHMTYARKNDAGARSIAQVLLSGGTTATSGTISLGNTYQYWMQVLENDPNTSAPFSTSGFNAATIGVKEIT